MVELVKDRWHDVSNRSSAQDTRRDSKWSSRWGPDDKDKESRTEKRTDVEKEDAQSDSQSSVGTNPRPASERDSESRDKRRPRHRIEGNSSSPGSYRAAPGFGLERGRAEGSNVGFTFGRGRSSVAVVRPPSAGSIGVAQLGRTDGVPGKASSGYNFCYPRGKLLDIYRGQKLDPSFAVLPEQMEEVPPITQVTVLEPLAFVTPAAEEEDLLSDIWKGNITSSGVSYNSFRKGITDNVTNVGELEPTNGRAGILPVIVSDDIVDTFGGPGNDNTHQADVCSSLNEGLEMDLMDGRDINHEGEGSKVPASTLGTNTDELM
ncbi:hypothetical protein U1Q18_039326 [Sarracenia purpurea var. burkii]